MAHPPLNWIWRPLIKDGTTSFAPHRGGHSRCGAPPSRHRDGRVRNGDLQRRDKFSGEQPPAHRCTQRAKRGRLAGRISGDVLTHEDATGARPYAAGLRAVLEANPDMYSDVLIDQIGKHVAPFAV